jgi:hypothetical protein
LVGCTAGKHSVERPVWTCYACPQDAGGGEAATPEQRDPRSIVGLCWCVTSYQYGA